MGSATKTPTGVDLSGTVDGKETSVNVAPGQQVHKGESSFDDASRPVTGDTVVDSAWGFLDTHRDVAGVDDVDIRRLRRRIDWRIVPLMFFTYALQFLDKLVYNYGASMGIIKDLDLAKGNRFSDVATFLFVALLIFEIPNVYLIQKLPAAKWLGINVVLWGIATACGAATHSYSGILVSRIFLGIFEATCSPSLMLISSQWYAKHEQAPRFSLWYLGIGVSQIIGGLISFGFQHVTVGTTLASWRIMFITLGAITVVLGASIILFLPDSPMKAKWMSDAEKVALLKHVSVNQTGIESSEFRWSEIREALVDPQIWLLTLAVILLAVPSGVITTYSVRLLGTISGTIGKSPKDGPKLAALLNMPSGLVSIFFTLLVGYGVQRQSHRWAWILVCVCTSLIGGGLMSFLPQNNKAGLLAGIYMVNATVAPLTLFYSWTVANVAGATKRAFAVVLISSAFSIGNIVGPQTFQQKDAPQFLPAKRALMASQAGCAVVTVSLSLYYVWSNKKRKHREEPKEESYMEAKAWTRMTDKENPSFRYSF